MAWYGWLMLALMPWAFVFGAAWGCDRARAKRDVTQGEAMLVVGVWTVAVIGIAAVNGGG